VSDVPAASKPLGFLKPALITSAAVLVGAAIVGGIVQGGPGAAGAAAGVALVMASYVISTAILARTDRVNPQMLVVVGMATYAVKFALLFLMIGWVSSLHWIGMKPMAVGVIVGVLAWTGAQIWWTYHARFTLDL
jgi:hypothetical protein